MATLKRKRYAARQQGVTLIEVLITLLLISFGLLGLAGLQVKLLSAEVESFQRSQALLVLADMSSRIMTNRGAANSYVTTAASPLGAAMTCPTTVATTVQRDLKDWCGSLQGAAETRDSGATKVTSLIGGRGCIERVGADYMVTVVWQGLTPTNAPPASVACGAGSFDGAAGSACVNDRCRRAVTTLVRVASLL